MKTPIKYRIAGWLNTETMTSAYGIQIRNEKGRWKNVSQDGTPLIYNDEEYALDVLSWLQWRKGEQPDFLQNLA